MLKAFSLPKFLKDHLSNLRMCLKIFQPFRTSTSYIYENPHPINANIWPNYKIHSKIYVVFCIYTGGIISFT